MNEASREEAKPGEHAGSVLEKQLGPNADEQEPTEPASIPAQVMDPIMALRKKIMDENKPVLITFRTRCGCHHQVEIMPPLKDVVNVPLVDYQRLPQNVAMTNEILRELNPRPEYRVFVLMLVSQRALGGQITDNRFEYIERLNQP